MNNGIKMMLVGVTGSLALVVAGLWFLTHNYHLTQFEGGVLVLAFFIGIVTTSTITLIGMYEL